MNETLLRTLIPVVTGVLVRRGADFATAEDAVQEALLRALATWPTDPPADPKGWLITVAWRKFLDTTRTETSRYAREARVAAEPPPGPTEDTADTLQLCFLCAHPSLTAASAVALTLRAVGGLTTRQIAEAYLVPEATMAQRISRAKRTVSGVRFDEHWRHGDLATVLRVLYLIFNEGYSGELDLADEAIRLTRQLTSMTADPEAAGLLSLMLLHHARRTARTTADGALVPLANQDRSRWDTELIAEGVATLQAALARDRLGEYQAQAAIAALHADAQEAEQTDWVQIVEWYDELDRMTNSPVVRLNRAVAVGQADGARAGLAALEHVDPAVPRYRAVAAYLQERGGDLALAARLSADAAHAATNVAERDYLTHQAARLHEVLRAERRTFMERQDIDAELSATGAQELLASTSAAHLAYTATDGTPRVIPVGFFWTGDQFVISTATTSPKVTALSSHPDVALAIDAGGTPDQARALSIRGRADVEIVDGVVEEYLAAARKSMDADAAAQFEQTCRETYDQMARIAITPHWVRYYDFGAGRMPRYLQDLVERSQL